MRKLIISIFLLPGFLIAHTQEMSTPMLNYNTLKNKLARSDEDIRDEKKSAKAKTWFSRGELFQDINDVNTQFLRIGMGTVEAKLFLKDPIEIQTVKEEGLEKEVYVYERINLIFENSSLVDWEEKEVIHPDPLPEALAAYEKTLELDEKGKYDEKVKKNMEKLKSQFENKAIRSFNEKEYDKSLESFENILRISDTRLYEGYIDTVILYNAGLVARNAGNHQKAIDYFQKVIDADYGGSDAYYLLKSEYIAVNDSDAAVKILERGFEKYPDTSLLLIEIVNHYLTSGDTEKGLKYLELAQEQESGNPTIYFVEGTLYERLGNMDKALEFYNKAIEVDPEYFNAYFNISALHYNHAVELYDKANVLQDMKAYNEAKKKADDELRKALVPMEKAHEINPEDRAALETLQTIYYRLQMTDKYEEARKKLSEL